MRVLVPGLMVQAAHDKQLFAVQAIAAAANPLIVELHLNRKSEQQL